MNLLLIEDDYHLGKALHAGLKEEFECKWVKTAELGKQAISNEKFDLLILDVNLPDMSGLEFLKKLRSEDNRIPTLILSAMSTKSQVVSGLNVGADDYLTKPFDFDELLARIHALSRRSFTQKTKFIYKDITLDQEGKVVYQNGDPINLSKKEFDILNHLLQNQGRYLSKGQIEQHLYSNTIPEFESNTIEVHISSIRKKLGKDIIKTIRGLGYIMEKSS